MLEEYTYEEPKQQGRSPDSLIQAIDRIERLEKENEKLNEACYRLEKENSDLLFENLKYKEAILSALNFLACADRISEAECNEQLAFDALRKALGELEK